MALLPRESAHRLDRLWLLVRDTCPLPLLDHWRDIVLDLLQARSMLTRLPFALGPLEGHRLAIDVPALTQALGLTQGRMKLTAPAAISMRKTRIWSSTLFAAPSALVIPLMLEVHLKLNGVQGKSVASATRMPHCRNWEQLIPWYPFPRWKNNAYLGPGTMLNSPFFVPPTKHNHPRA